MSEYVTFSTIIMFVFGMMWSKNTFLNIMIKTILFIMVVFGLYLLFGPENLITKFAH